MLKTWKVKMLREVSRQISRATMSQYSFTAIRQFCFASSELAYINLLVAKVLKLLPLCFRMRTNGPRNTRQR